MWPHGFDRSALSPDGRKMMLRCASWQCVGSWTWRQNRRRPGASTVNWYMSHNISIYISGNFRGGRSGLSFATQVQSANGASAPAINRAGCPRRSPPSWAMRFARPIKAAVSCAYIVQRRHCRGGANYCTISATAAACRRGRHHRTWSAIESRAEGVSP